MLAQELERVVEHDRVRRHLALRVRESEVAADVELDEVDAGGDGRLERAQRVRGRDRRRAAVTDDERPVAVAAAEVDAAHAVRFTTTIAQSSASSPPP